MALSEKWVLEKARALLWNPDYTGFNPVAFTRTIESEVRKQDTELIRQMLEALKVAVLQNDCDMVMTGEELRQSRSAIKVARARLEGKT